jgi:hypothetical protein
MGNHSKSITVNAFARVAGYRVLQHVDGLELIANRKNNSWPKFANRLRSLGFLSGIQTQSKQTRLFVSVDFETIQGLLASHARKSRVSRSVIAGVAVPVAAILCFVPLGGKSVVQKPPKSLHKTAEPCSLEVIRKWIEGSDESNEIKALSTSVLGGVTVGTLECEDGRYSYTLGSEEPKRVLKLQKLDS